MKRLTVIGLLIIVGSLVVGVATSRVGRGIVGTETGVFDDTTRVYVMFDSADTVASLDRNVRMAGANAGQIGEIERVGDDSKVELILEDENLRIAEDARAELRPHLAFEGNSFVELYPGSPSAPPLGDRPLPVAQTRDYVSLDKVLRVADEPTRDALEKSLDALADSLRPPQEKSLQRSFRALDRLYPDLAVGARAARGRDGDELAGAVQGISRTVDAVAEEERQINPGLRAAQRTFSAVNTAEGNPLDATLAQLPPSLEALERGGRTLRGVVDRLDPLAVELRPALAQLAPAQRELRPLLRELRPVLADAPPVVSDLRGALDAGARAAGPGRRLIADLRPTVTLADERLLPGLLRPTSLGPPLYEQTFRGFATGFSGAIAHTVTKEQDTGFGPGNGFRFNIPQPTPATAPAAPFPGGGVPDCEDVPEAARPNFEELDLCEP